MTTHQATRCPYRRASEIDFMDPLVQEHWFEAYDLLRAEAPVYYMPQLGMYVLTRYDDIEYVLRRPTLFTAGPDVTGAEPLIRHPEARALYEEKGWPRYTRGGQQAHRAAALHPRHPRAETQEARRRHHHPPCFDKAQ